MESAFLMQAADRKKEIEMRKRLMWFVCLGAPALVTCLCGGLAWATPATGFVGTTIALGRFGEIDVLNTQVLATNPWRDDGQGKNVWLSLQKTKGASDLYVQNNVVQPGGDSGWHSHPGSNLVIVTAGTVTDYESDDPGCKPTVYTQGMGFVDAGVNHVHLIRNEGTVVATTMAVQLIPANAARRIDEPQPSNCH
jgi:quercetin dioxygenase-like cupin family protein